LRRSHAGLFLQGEYAGLEATGTGQSHIVALLRQHASRTLIAVVPRLVGGLLGNSPGPPVGSVIWDDTRIALPLSAPRSYRCVFTGETVASDDGGLPVAQVLQSLPVALLLGP
jgi:(1->4)-alpha-D-glucan 1-alpha-D-glucosylmutase